MFRPLLCVFAIACESTAAHAPDGGIEVDAAIADAAIADAAIADVAIADAAIADAELADASAQDSAVTDASPRDAGADAGPLVLSKAYTEHLGRLTDTTRNPIRPLGLIGTDLGASFERNGEIIFLFGDSWLTGPDLSRWDDDSAARTDLALPADGSLPQLQ